MASKTIEFSLEPCPEIVDAELDDAMPLEECKELDSHGQQEQESPLESNEDDFVQIAKTQEIRPNFTGKFLQTLTLYLPKLTISAIMKGHEVLVMGLNSVRMEQKTTDTDKILYFGLDRFQIDNNYEADPLF
jgi:hypothetical protein